MPRAAGFDLLLIGFGHVARRFVRLLDELGPRLAGDHDVQARVVGIATARHGCVFNPDGVDALNACARVEQGAALEVTDAPGRAADAFALLELAASRATHTRPLVVIETTTLNVEDGQPAIDHVKRAMAIGAHVITANKGPAAFAYRDLRERARDANVAFLFEGAVMDGVPIFNLVRETLPAVRVVGFRAVLNSTTNHILTEMERGVTFAAALEAMQQAGVAEADASLDIDGWDAAAKVSALANVLMDADLTPHTVTREGIRGVTEDWIRSAAARGCRVKLLATAVRRGEHVAARVAPSELDAGDLLARLPGTSNAIVFDTDVLGEVAITELDGGLTQTAYALVSDLVAVRRGWPGPPAAPARRTL